MKTTPVIGVDVDGVICDLHTVWLESYNRATGTSVIDADVTRWEISAFTGADIFDHLTPELYDTALPFPGALCCVDRMRANGWLVRYVTSCPNNTAPAKLAWLRRHGFVEDSETDFVPMTDKRRAPVDWLIDDRASTIREFTGASGFGRGVLINRAHNAGEVVAAPRINHLRDFFAVKFWLDEIRPLTGGLSLR